WIKSYPITPDLSRYVDNPGGDDGAADLDSGHGTHVAGSVLGNGSAGNGLSGVNAPIRGLAHKAKLVFQAVEQEMQWKASSNYQRYGRYLLAGIPLDLTTLFADAYERKVRIHSNSWGGGDAGAYDTQSEQLDRFVWEHKDFCVLVAAGNDGTDRDGDGRINPMSVSSPATAKNCVCVGASENERPAFDANTYGGWWVKDYPVAPFRNDPMADDSAHVAAFSSRGPTKEGRAKPDVVAPGTFVLSTRSTMIAPNNMAWGAFPPSRMYFYMGGTSMATPLTAGAIALIREYLRKHRKIKNPSAALLKAALIAGSARLPDYGAEGAVLDNDQGFGRVDLDAILAPSAPAQSEFLQVSPGLRTGEIFSKEIKIQSGDAPFRVVMAYSDYPGPALVNNLNLILTAPDGKRFVGNHTAGATLTMDTKNNVEAVNIATPVIGKWVVEVIGSNIPQGPQDFALIYTAHSGEAPPSELIRLEAIPERVIPDNSAEGVKSVISAARSGVVESIKIGVEIRHTYIGDLRVKLSAPNGTLVVLHNRSGASADNISRTYDVHNTPALGALTGVPVRGDWLLRVSDHARLDAGRLHRWTLEIGLGTSKRIRKESEPSVPIPDNKPAGIRDHIEVSEAGAVKEIKVAVDITHTWISDLKVQVIAPSGKTVALHDRTGGGQDNIIKTYDVASLAGLAGFSGENVRGTWALKVSDHAGRDVGKLNRWGIEIVL
ncbi:MAG: proprotein convertase P-domain-containing protein, partial [Pseudomonadota bacterium]